jgi:hypothetical protein
MWCDQTLDGKGYDIIKSNKKGFIIDLRGGRNEKENTARMGGFFRMLGGD